MLLHEARLLLHRMLHFVQNTQYSFSVDVIDIGWTEFREKLATAKSLDEILAFHEDYLGLVEEKCFLPPDNPKNSVTKMFSRH